MRKAWVFITVTIIFLAGFTGCKTVRTYEVEKPRTDLEVQGNRGFLVGEPTGEVPANRLGDTRKVSVLEIELPEGRKAKKAGTAAVTPTEEEAVLPPTSSEYEDTSYVEETTTEGLSQTSEEYIVGKDDTLQKISYKFYGTTKKWKYLYDVNKDVIKNPDRLYPGMKLSVPSLK